MSRFVFSLYTYLSITKYFILMKLFIIFVLVQIDAKENSILENFNPPKYSF